jgi:hypothetical protein
MRWDKQKTPQIMNDQLDSYLVSPTDGYQQSHVLSFVQHYQEGVLAVAYHQPHNMPAQ